jgi:hypothetical protein
LFDHVEEDEQLAVTDRPSTPSGVSTRTFAVSMDTSACTRGRVASSVA